MKKQLRKLKTFNYWLPIVFSIAIGLGVIIGSFFSSTWLGMLIGIVLGLSVVFVYNFKKR